ncbi:MAG: TrkA family potassium uptake protein [Firmicutes bacterium]|nr:TrkA family potassium uptake protein [Bacillota bacterium]
MFVIVVGCSRVGARLALQLVSEGHEVAVVDQKQESFRRLGAGFAGKTVLGTGLDLDILKRAGAERADALATVTNGDNINIVVAQVARKHFGIPRVVARMYDPERAAAYREMGMEIMCPTLIGSQLIKEKILGGGA